MGLSAGRADVRRWSRAALASGTLCLALLFVAMVTYLPHMQTLEGQIFGSGGAVVNRSDESPWLRLGSAYVGWANGTQDDYEYPMHADASVHWVRAAAIQRADSMAYPDPYTGQPPSGEGGTLSLKGSVHERGFVLAFAQFQELTGIPFILIIRFFPALFAALSAWLVWVALRPWPGAAVAAALVALVPSSPRFLGIAFWVPAGLGLAWLATALVVGRYAGSDRRTLFLALVLGAWSFYIHLIAGFAFLLVFLAAIPVSLGRIRRDLLTFGALILLPLLWFFGAFASDFDKEASVLGFLPTDFTIFDQLGVPFLMAWVFGSGMVALRPPIGGHRVPVVSATIGSIVAFGLMVSNHWFDLHLYALYDRWHQPMALLATVPVAYGVVEAVRWVGAYAARWADRPALPRFVLRSGMMNAVGAAAVVVVAGSIATPGLAQHLDEPYYYFMTDEAWQRMQAASTLGPEYEVFLIHPWQAPVFNAMTGKIPYTWLAPGEAPFNGDDYIAYHQGRYNDPVWLVERDISLLMEAPGATPYFRPGPGGVLVLDDPYIRQLHQARQNDGG